MAKGRYLEDISPLEFCFPLPNLQVGPDLRRWRAEEMEIFSAHQKAEKRNKNWKMEERVSGDFGIQNRV